MTLPAAPPPPANARGAGHLAPGSASGARSRRGWRRLLVLAGVVLLLIAALTPFLLGRLGHWLIVADDLAVSDVIFVHAGHLPFRAIEAARIYNDGYAGEVWLAPISPTPESEALAELGIEMPPGHYWRTQVLERLRVPAAAIQLLPVEVLNTRDEVEAVAHQLQRRGLSSAILVTSKQHSRRVRMLWRRVAPPGLKAIVRPSAADPFDPDAWWTNTDSAQAVLHELAGIAAAWLGLGIRPAGR